MPISTASRKGVSAVAAAAGEQRVVLTSLGRPVAVVESAERLDDAIRSLREGSRSVVEAYAEIVRGRSATLSLHEMCDRLGISEADVHERAAALRAGA